nr:helix-turn-helix domain-containing protein [Sinirhodobacter populi]
MLSLIGGKWKGVVLWHLLQGTLRVNEIRRRLPNVTQRMLTNQLRELEADGFVIRTVYAEVPPRGNIVCRRAAGALNPSSARSRYGARPMLIWREKAKFCRRPGE